MAAGNGVPARCFFPVFSVKGTGMRVPPLAHFPVSCRLVSTGWVDGLMNDGCGGGSCLVAVSVLGSAIKGDGAGIKGD